MKVVVAGGTGFIGERLVQQLVAAGDSVTLLTRSGKVPPALKQKINVLAWDGKTQGPWTQAVHESDAVINLCGESIASKRWTPQQKTLLKSSRLDPTRVLVEAIRSSKIGPKTLINASAVGFYGSIPEDEVDEFFIQGHGFLPKLCADWEATAKPVEDLGVRLVLLRTGIVLGPKKGALKKMIPPFKFFMGGPLASGKQWFPWVHVQDVVSIILFALKNETLSGPVNVTAPFPVRMEEFSATLGRVLNRPSWLRIPGWLLKILMGEMAVMLIDGQKAVPKKVLKSGFKFRYGFLESALIAIINTDSRQPPRG